MKAVVGLTLIINTLTILILLLGLVYKFENPKVKSYYGYTLVGGMILTLASLTVFTLSEIFYKNNFIYSGLLFVVASPFIIGKLVKFETLKKYTIIQILCFCFSLCVLFFEYFRL